MLLPFAAAELPQILQTRQNLIGSAASLATGRDGKKDLKDSIHWGKGQEHKDAICINIKLPKL